MSSISYRLARSRFFETSWLPPRPQKLFVIFLVYLSAALVGGASYIIALTGEAYPALVAGALVPVGIWALSRSESLVETIQRLASLFNKRFEDSATASASKVNNEIEKFEKLLAEITLAEVRNTSLHFESMITDLRNSIESLYARNEKLAATLTSTIEEDRAQLSVATERIKEARAFFLQRNYENDEILRGTIAEINQSVRRFLEQTSSQYKTMPSQAGRERPTNIMYARMEEPSELKLARQKAILDIKGILATQDKVFIYEPNSGKLYRVTLGQNQELFETESDEEMAAFKLSD